MTAELMLALLSLVTLLAAMGFAYFSARPPQPSHDREKYRKDDRSKSSTKKDRA